MKILELRRQRAALLQQIRTLADTAERENRGFTGEERQTEATLDAEIGRLEVQIKAEETRERLQGVDPSAPVNKPNPEGYPGASWPKNDGRWWELKQRDGEWVVERGRKFRPWDPNGTDERSTFNRYLVHGPRGLDASEYRALSVGVPGAGGYLTAPLAVAEEFVAGINAETFATKLCRVVAVENAQSLGVPFLEADVADGDWTSELLTGNEDSDLTVGRRELTPYPLAKRVKISNKLLRMSTLNPDQIVTQRLAYKFAVSLEKAFLLGNGTSQPLGVFVASADGIDATRDVQTDMQPESITADGLISALHHLQPQYRRRASWIFHDDAIRQIRKLKDGVNGDYLWQPGLAAGQPDQLLGLPVYSSVFAPSTFTAGQYIGIVGDFQFYWFAQALSFTVQVLDQLYAETNQTGFIGRLEIDGAPVISQAFARVQLASV